jgi:hypothetical protein
MMPCAGELSEPTLLIQRGSYRGRYLDSARIRVLQSIQMPGPMRSMMMRLIVHDCAR